jgi:D-glucuronyl C5-epimerase C-terminus
VAGSTTEARFVPMRPPFLPAPSTELSWLVEDGELVILADGYPARLVGGAIHVHPMHGRYILTDLLRRYELAATSELRNAVRTVADAIVGRAEVAGNALLMWYEGQARSGLVDADRHLSGLPQAYYAALFARLAGAIGPEYRRAADGFFEPLLRPVEAGGLLHTGAPGHSLAMVPMRPRDWILNGWLSMLVSAAEYARARSSAPAHDLVDANLSTLVAVLPAYDAPAHRLSRYMLPGILMMRLDVDPPGVVEISGLRTVIPDEPEAIPIRLSEASGWTPRVPPDDGRPLGPDAFASRPAGFRMVARLSRAPYPRTNRLAFTITTLRPCRLALTAHIGEFDPEGSTTIERRWVALSETEVAAGTHDVDLPIPYEPVDLFSYPTSFARRFHGRPQNSYHGTHIVRLRQLAELTGTDSLRGWADRWRRYVDEWQTIDRYAGFGCWTPEGTI